MAEDAAALALKPMRYFSHDSDAREDIKCKYLIREFGMGGYGMWWVLCEILAAAEGHRVDYKDRVKRWYLEEEMRSTGDELNSFLDTCAEVGLINGELWDSGIISSDRMNGNALYFGEKKEHAYKGARARWASRLTGESAGA